MPASPSDTQTDDPVQLVAALMILVGEEATAEILKELGPDEVYAITREMIRLPRVPGPLAESALTRLSKIILAREYDSAGGIQFARRVLTTAFGAETARQHLDTVSGNEQPPRSRRVSLAAVDPARLALLLRKEHPQTIALLLSRMNLRQASGVLEALPAELRPEVVYRMASLDETAPEVIDKVLRSIDQKLKALGGAKRESHGGVKFAAQLCNQLDAAASDLVLAEIEQRNEDMATKIRNVMFVFEDILSLDPEAVKEMLARVERKNLVIALKGASEELRKHICGTMSQRAAAMLLDEIDTLGPVKIRAVEEAQREVIESLRELEREGVLSLRATTSDVLLN